MIGREGYLDIKNYEAWYCVSYTFGSHHEQNECN